jgi:hypothetical protein
VQNGVLKGMYFCTMRAALLFIHVDVLAITARTFNGLGKGSEHLLHLPLAETNPAQSGSHGLPYYSHYLFLEEIKPLEIIPNHARSDSFPDSHAAGGTFAAWDSPLAPR